MDSDIIKIYEKLQENYPISVSSSLAVSPNFKIDFPILCGISSLGKFELFYGDLDFEFYAVQDNGQFLAHFHLQSAAEAEKTVIDFMNGKLTIIPNNT